MNDMFSHKDSVNGCMQLNSHKKCPPFNADFEPLFLAQQLRDNAGLTMQLVEEIVEPYAAWHTQHLLLSTTWNEAAKWATQKHKSCTITTSKTVAPHPEQVLSLLQQVTENKSLNQNNDMVINEPVPDGAGPSMRPDIELENTAALPYDDELELST